MTTTCPHCQAPAENHGSLRAVAPRGFIATYTCESCGRTFVRWLARVRRRTTA